MFRVYIHVSSRGLEGLESRLNARFGERSRRLSSGMLYCVQRSCEAAGITEGPKDRVVRAHARGLANGHGLLDARGTRPERVGRLATADCRVQQCCRCCGPRRGLRASRQFARKELPTDGHECG